MLQEVSSKLNIESKVRQLLKLSSHKILEIFTFDNE